jgi:pimeloyl-ACP methyl ester carboxylesterase
MSLTLPLYVETHGLDPSENVDTFVLVHGYGGSSFSWRYWLPGLARRGHVVLVDLKGFGAAPKPDDGLYAPGHQAELVHRLVVQRNLHRVTMVGHSLGGGVALLTALRMWDESPVRLHRLVLVAGAAYRQKLPPFVALAHHPIVSRLLARLLGPRRVVRSVLRSIVYDPSRISIAQIEGYAPPLAEKGAIDALIQAARQIVPTDIDDLAERYRTLSVPTLLLWGRHDRVVPLEVGERLARELPDATLVVLESCGHLPAEELPDSSMAALQTFLDRTDEPGSTNPDRRADPHIRPWTGPHTGEAGR